MLFYFYDWNREIFTTTQLLSQSTNEDYLQLPFGVFSDFCHRPSESCHGPLNGRDNSHMTNSHVAYVYTSHDICTSLCIPSLKYLYSSNVFILLIAEALISQSAPAQFSLDTSDRNVLFKNHLHVFYHSCPNRKPSSPSPVFTKCLFCLRFWGF